MAGKIGAYYLSANTTAQNRMFEPARSNDFRFYVSGLDNLLRAGYTGTEEDARLPESLVGETLEFSVVSSSVPQFSQDVIQIRRGNSIMKAAGLPSFNTGSLVIDDFIGADGKSVLMAWQNQSYNVNTQCIGYMADYKKDCWLIEYDPNYKMVRQWLLYGCWISNLQQDEFSQDNGDKRRITATIEYDWAEMKMPDEIV